MLESNVDHSGRPVRVWLKNPVAATENDAYYEGTVSYGAPDNYVDIPYTASAGPLGQTSPTFPISTTAADYQVHVQGVSWSDGDDYRTDANYAFIGIVTGNGPSATPVTFDISDQRPAFLISLDRAYRANSVATPAPGRKIWVDKWAMELVQSASSQRGEDIANAALLVNKLGESITGGMGVNVYGSWQDDVHLAFNSWRNAADAASGGDLQPVEDVDLAATNTINFNRGAVDLASIEDIIRNGAAVLVTDTTSNAQDGLYMLAGITDLNTVTVVNFDGTDPGFSNESNVNARIMLMATVFCSRDLFDTTFDDEAFGQYIYFGQAHDGIQITQRGAPQGASSWLSCNSTEGANRNQHALIHAGRFLARGGGKSRVGQGLVGGLAQFASDKVDTTEIYTTWLPSEGEDWGFDYRGSSYGNDTSQDDPSYQLAATFRHPYWMYNSGANDLEASEPFTRYDADQLGIASAGDIEKLVGDPGTTPASSPGSGWVLAEVRYSGGDTTDGTYLVKDVDISNKRVTLMNIKTGGSPGFPAGTGTVRFYGGSFVGPIYGPMGADTVGWMHQITVPTYKTGGLRIVNAFQRWQILCSGMDGTPGQVQFYVYAGKVFATSLTARQSTVGSLPSAGAIEASDMYPGDLHLTSTGPDNILLPDTLGTATDRIKRESGSTWQYWRSINTLKGHPYETGGSPAWYLGPDGDEWIDGAGTTQAIFVIPLYMPHGCTLNQVECSLTAVTSDGTSSSMGIDVKRMTWNGSSSVSLNSSGVTRTSGSAGTQGTHSHSCDQNNVIDNTQYRYWLWIEGSASSGDRIWGARMQMTVTALGQSLFDAR